MLTDFAVMFAAEFSTPPFYSVMTGNNLASLQISIDDFIDLNLKSRVNGNVVLRSRHKCEVDKYLHETENWTSRVNAVTI